MEERENLNYFLTLNLLGFVLFPAVRARLIFSKLHTCEKIGIPTVYRGGGGGGQLGEMERVADERDGEGGRRERWGGRRERWGGWQTGEVGKVVDGRDGETDGRDGEGSRWE